MIDALLEAGATITAYDPEAMENVKVLYGDKISFVENEYDALKDADALIIATEWSIFRNPDFNKIGDILKDKVIFDGRNLFEVEDMNDKGFFYESIGRKTIKK